MIISAIVFLRLLTEILVRIKNPYLVASLALILATVIWGSSFIVSKGILTTMPPMAFIGSRFLVGGLVGLICFPKRVWRADYDLWKKCFLIALIYLTGQICQIIALLYTTATICGFITGLYVIITPLICWFGFSEKLAPLTVIAAVIAFLGMSILTSGNVSFGLGELLSLIGAFCYAGHIIAVAKLAYNKDPLTVGIIQVLIIGSLASIMAIPWGFSFPITFSGWIAFLYIAIIAAFFALVLQAWGQQFVPAAQASIIMASEPVWSATFAVIGGESLTLRIVIGGSLVVGAILLIEGGAYLRRKRKLK